VSQLHLSQSPAPTLLQAGLLFGLSRKQDSRVNSRSGANNFMTSEVTSSPQLGTAMECPLSFCLIIPLWDNVRGGKVEVDKCTKRGGMTLEGRENKRDCPETDIKLLKSDMKGDQPKVVLLLKFFSSCFWSQHWYVLTPLRQAPYTEQPVSTELCGYLLFIMTTFLWKLELPSPFFSNCTWVVLLKC